MERYDYRKAVISDIKDYIKDNYEDEELFEKLDEWDDFEQELYDDLFVSDSVTGNASGSYYCNAWRAEECLTHNWDLLADAIEEFGGDCDILRQGPEACDVTIRCYYLGECLNEVLGDLKEKLEEELVEVEDE